MGKLQEIKDNWAKEQGYDNWEDYYNDRYYSLSYASEDCVNEVARRYAKSVAGDALKRAAESVDAGCELAVLDTEINLDL